MTVWCFFRCYKGGNVWSAVLKQHRCPCRDDYDHLLWQKTDVMSMFLSNKRKMSLSLFTVYSGVSARTKTTWKHKHITGSRLGSDVLIRLNTDQQVSSDVQVTDTRFGFLPRADRVSDWRDAAGNSHQRQQQLCELGLSSASHACIWITGPSTFFREGTRGRLGERTREKHCTERMRKRGKTNPLGVLLKQPELF